MVLFLLLATLLVLVIMEVRIWKAAARLVWRAGSSLFPPAQNKDT